MNSKQIQHHLSRNYATSKYVVSNVFLFCHQYGETDCLIVKDNGYVYDIEIKVSRADFKRDFTKLSKHEIITTGKLTRKKWNTILLDYEKDHGNFSIIDRPNRFYFCVPDGLVKLNEVPNYAGLLYVMADGEIVKVKEAPLLHKEIIEVEKKLCRKFYYHYLELKEVKKAQHES